MTITNKQKQERRNFLGSSDVPAIFGLDPFKNAFDIWLEKTGRLDEAETETSVMTRGKIVEPGLINWAERQLGKLQRRVPTQIIDGLPIGSHVDAKVAKTGRPVEAKTAGIYAPLRHDYGEPNTDQVPDYVIIQCQVHLICTHQDLCYVPTLVVARGAVMYEEVYIY